MIAHSAQEQMEQDKAQHMLEKAGRLGISVQELASRGIQLKLAWDAGGGFKGARARLRFAKSFLAKEGNKK